MSYYTIDVQGVRTEKELLYCTSAKYNNIRVFFGLFKGQTWSTSVLWLYRIFMESVALALTTSISLWRTTWQKGRL